MSAGGSHEFTDWEQCYSETDVEEMPWYYQRLDKDFREIVDELSIKSGRVLDLGTGPGTQAVALAKIDLDVIATDISSNAVHKAQAMATEQNASVDFRQDDILDTKLTKQQFDYVFDRGCFHTIAPEKRHIYIENVWKILKAGGYLFLKTFSLKEPGHEGPYRFAPEDIERQFSQKFEIVLIRETVFEGAHKPLRKALFAVLRR